MISMTMDLSHWGWNDEVEEQAAGILQPGQRLARVTAVDRGSFLIGHQGGETRAELAGRLRFALRSAEDMPCVGDWVCAQASPDGDLAMLHDVLPRKSFLRRKSPDTTAGFQMIAANIDVAFVIQSCLYDFNVARLHRYLVMASEGRIEPRVVLSKSDLVSADELQGRLDQLRHAGVTAPVLPLSNETGEGLAAFEALLAPGKTYCLLGSSGVGKSTLINRLAGNESLPTRNVSGTGEGVHTTSRRQLLVLGSGAILVDTPGMRELGILGASDGVDAAFSDISEFAAQCRFADCTHTQEPGCAVLAALESGTLDQDRFQNYLKLRKEAAYHGMSYVEKRKKDKAFGRMAKKVLEQKQSKPGR